MFSKDDFKMISVLEKEEIMEMLETKEVSTRLYNRMKSENGSIVERNETGWEDTLGTPIDYEFVYTPEGEIYIYILEWEVEIVDDDDGPYEEMNEPDGTYLKVLKIKDSYVKEMNRLKREYFK